MAIFKISKLALANFRNLNFPLVEFSDSINCIFGDNGNGKTNLLEAIYFLSNRKSFRKNTSFPQIINMNSDNLEIAISGLLKDNSNKNHTISGKISYDSQYWYYDNNPLKSKFEIESIFINPFDSYQFHTISSFRRSFFDQHFSLISLEYKKILSNYNKTLKFRNTLIAKQSSKFKEQLKAIDLEFAKYSKQLLDLRPKFLEELSPYCSLIFKKIFNEEHLLEIKMESKFFKFSEEKIYAYFQDTLEKDLAIGHTNYGVHRDDYVFHFDGINSFEFCSLGQQKMSFLSLNFAYLELFGYKFKSYPIVLIDDVSGELDGHRWKRLIEYLKEKPFQVFITTANDEFKKELEKINTAKKFYVTNGNIS